MRIAVTGGTGFVGRHLLSQLKSRGHRVRALVRHPARRSLPALQGAEITAGDLDDPDALRGLVDGADAVVHLVGIIAERGAATFDAVHVDGTRRLVQAARAAGIRRFIHMSALGARDEPSATGYHRTKRRAEDLVQGSGIPAAIFRPAVIVGAGSVPIRTLARVHRFSPIVPVFGDGRFPMQPVWIEDVTLAFALAVERPGLSGLFELGGPEVVTYEEFVRSIGRAAGHRRPVVHVPLALVRAAARVFDRLGPLAPITSDQLQMLVEGSVTPDNAIERVFGIRPMALHDALGFLRGGG
ncbi:MAG: complex I NDUFA9 subunit family protein [Gemmatimonadales bacterium]